MKIIVFDSGAEQPEDKGIYLKDIIENYDGKEEIISARIGSAKNFYCENKTGKSFCLIKSHCFGFICGKIKREFTALECERLQTVPENYTNHVPKTHRKSMLGNGWTVDVIAHIFRGMNENTN